MSWHFGFEITPQSAVVVGGIMGASMAAIIKFVR